MTDTIPHPFHGDPYLPNLFYNIIQSGDVKHFVETGSFHGITTEWVASAFPDLICYSCEVSNEHYKYAKERLINLKNTTLTNEDSLELLKRLANTHKDDTTIFWLDAHDYGFRWPLFEEVTIIAQNWKHAYVIIDDFQVPGRDWFGFDIYENQICSYDYIYRAIGSRHHDLWYPIYSFASTMPKAWQRGWGLITFDVHFTPETWMEKALSQHTPRIQRTFTSYS